MYVLTQLVVSGHTELSTITINSSSCSSSVVSVDVSVDDVAVPGVGEVCSLYLAEEG